MTTYAYDGRYLACDRQTTRSFSSKGECLECHSEVSHLGELVTKLRAVKGIEFQKEIVKVWTFSGKSDHIAIVKAAFINKIEFDVLESLCGIKGGLSVNAILLTETSLWEISWENSLKPSCTKIEDKFFSGGSGGSIAMFAMKELKFSAFEAVALATRVDKFSGMGVDIYDLVTNTLSRMKDSDSSKFIDDRVIGPVVSSRSAPPAYRYDFTTSSWRKV